jgi:hypothetical protein
VREEELASLQEKACHLEAQLQAEMVFEIAPEIEKA